VRLSTQERTFLSPRFSSMSFSGLTRSTTETFSCWLGNSSPEVESIADVPASSGLECSDSTREAG
jgi:hypothetical protein